MSATVTESPVETAPTMVDEGRRRFGVGVLTLAVVASLLAGFAVALLTIRPDPPPGDTSAEAGFARDMITHHDQAVTMGVIAYRNAATPEVRRLGYDIAMVQQGEIGIMHQWLRAWGLSPTGSEPRMAWMQEDLDPGLVRDGLMPGMATSEQLAQLREAEGTEVDRLFLDLMIHHHLGGIHMIDGVLERSDDPDVTWLAEAMRAAQQKELRVMQDLQTQLGG
jgi:uncharacterized protein (DUF305 family)